MGVADEALFDAIEVVDWFSKLADAGTPLESYFRLVEHESHHHGQLINFIYACRFPIPACWADSWGLTRDNDQ